MLLKSIVHRPGASAASGSSLEMQSLRPHPSILIRNVHLNHITEGVTGTFPFEKSGWGRRWRVGVRMAAALVRAW